MVTENGMICMVMCKGDHKTLSSTKIKKKKKIDRTENLSSWQILFVAWHLTYAKCVQNVSYT